MPLDRVIHAAVAKLDAERNRDPLGSYSPFWKSFSKRAVT
jgi:hypothetical protein